MSDPIQGARIVDLPLAPPRPAPLSAPVPEISPVTLANFRLVIEEDEASGAYVYRTLDRMTGEVMSQYPSEALLKLRQDPAYAAGTVVDQSV